MARRVAYVNAGWITLPPLADQFVVVLLFLFFHRLSQLRVLLDVFATNLNSPLIYAATKNGHIFAVRPVLRPGTVGEIVLLETPLNYMFD